MFVLQILPRFLIKIKSMKIALAQLNSNSDWKKNFEHLTQWISKAAKKSAKAILFPENTLYMGSQRKLVTLARVLEKQGVLFQIADLAKQHKIAVLLGGYPEPSEDPKRVYNSSVWIDEHGLELARYRKIHLFDATPPGGKQYSESKNYIPGSQIKWFTWNKIKIGMSICYDLRFPEQFRIMARQGVEWFLVPAAFTKETGKHHWHALLRARAIENFATVLAPAQTGNHPLGRKTYGHSLCVNAWGDVICDSGKRPGLTIAKIQVDQSRKLRARFSAL